ncbi:LysR family transcriptional regulator [Bacillus sp. ISL-18]|uniref:LysR family transcriptional regulator n=1 Tax=Bacillus sp. ISL-18 TaxID=2819118 RepID=UPI001BE602CB|nr:LysR family transcriptional regulator [Bacillus sp. ISL-18]MBT2657917.1 LysR family transcriptional regulator [Bacillus sp. ISL-18]
MNFEQLEYVKEIIETKSMSIAAQNLHITQSAISQSISLLEKEFGVQLFKRSRLGTVPTAEGKTIIKKLLEISKKTEELKEEVQSLTSSFNGELKIATSPSIFMTFLLKALARFKNDYPQIQVTIKEMEKEDVISSVDQEKVDLGLITLFNPGDKLPSHIIFHSFHYEGNFNIIAPKDSALAFNKELQLVDIKDYPFIMYERRYFRHLIEDLEKQYEPINVILRTKNSEVIKRAVSEGLGISLVSSLMLKDDPYIESGKIVAIPLTGYPLNFNSVYGGVFLNGGNQYRLVKKFLEYVEI